MEIAALPLGGHIFLVQYSSYGNNRHMVNMCLVKYNMPRPLPRPFRNGCWPHLKNLVQYIFCLKWWNYLLPNVSLLFIQHLSLHQCFSYLVWHFIYFCYNGDEIICFKVNLHLQEVILAALSFFPYKPSLDRVERHSITPHRHINKYCCQFLHWGQTNVMPSVNGKCVYTNR